MSACLWREILNAVRHIGFEYREHPGNDFVEPSLLSYMLVSIEQDGGKVRVVRDRV